MEMSVAKAQVGRTPALEEGRATWRQKGLWAVGCEVLRAAQIFRKVTCTFLKAWTSCI